MRTGTVHVKAAKNDPVYQTFTVRDRDGALEYYHPQFNSWYTLPAEWVDLIRWDR